jgi:hypothetical protein
MAWPEAVAVAVGYLLLSLAGAACVAMGVYQAAELFESHPFRARALLLQASAATAVAHLLYMLLDPRALAANAVGLADQAALQLVLRSRAWPAVPLSARPLLAAAALVVLDQCAWAAHAAPRVPGAGLAAAAGRLPRLVGLLAVFVWPVPAGVLLTLAVAADPLPMSVGSPRTAAAAPPVGADGPPLPEARLQPRRLQGPWARDAGGGGSGGAAHAAAAPAAARAATQGRLLRFVRQGAARLGFQLEPGRLPIRQPNLKM